MFHAVYLSCMGRFFVYVHPFHALLKYGFWIVFYVPEACSPREGARAASQPGMEGNALVYFKL